MTLGSRVYDTSAPDRVGVFNGFRTSFGRKMAVVKFPGAAPTQIPAERVATVAQARTRERLSEAQYMRLLVDYGVTRRELHRRAKSVGLSLAEAYEAIVECEDGCECETCRGDA